VCAGTNYTRSFLFLNKKKQSSNTKHYRFHIFIRVSKFLMLTVIFHPKKQQLNKLIKKQTFIFLVYLIYCFVFADVGVPFALLVTNLLLHDPLLNILSTPPRENLPKYLISPCVPAPLLQFATYHYSVP